MARERGDRRSDFDLSLRPAEAHPTEVEHLPASQSLNALLECRFAVSEPDAAVIGGVTGGRRTERLADFSVVEPRLPPGIDEALNSFA